MMYQVLGERVLVKKEIKKAVEGAAAALLIPDEAKQSGQLCLRGTVVGCGNKVEYVKAGDTVYFSKYAGQYLQIEDSFEDPDLIVMREDEVLAIEVENATESSD